MRRIRSNVSVDRRANQFIFTFSSLKYELLEKVSILLGQLKESLNKFAFKYREKTSVFGINKHQNVYVNLPRLRFTDEFKWKY